MSVILLLSLILKNLCDEQFYMDDYIKLTCNLKMKPNYLEKENMIIVMAEKIDEEYLRRGMYKTYNHIGIENLKILLLILESKKPLDIFEDMSDRTKISDLDCYNFLSFIKQYSDEDLNYISDFSHQPKERLTIRIIK